MRLIAALLERYREGDTTGCCRNGAQQLIKRCRRYAVNCGLDESDVGPGAGDRPAGGASTPAEVELQLWGLWERHRAQVEFRAAWDKRHKAITSQFEAAVKHASSMEDKRAAAAEKRAAAEEKTRQMKELTDKFGQTPARPTRTEALLGLAARAAGPREGGADLPLLVGAAVELYGLLYGADRLTLYDSRYEDSALKRILVVDAKDRFGRRVGEGVLASLAEILAGSGDPEAVDAVCSLKAPEWAGLPEAVLAALRPALQDGETDLLLRGWLQRGGDASTLPPWWCEGLARTHFRLGGGSLREPGRFWELVGCERLQALATFQVLAERRGPPAAPPGGPAPPDLGRLWVRKYRAFLEFVADPDAAALKVAQAFEALERWGANELTAGGAKPPFPQDAWATRWGWRNELAKCADAVCELGLGFGKVRGCLSDCEVETLAFDLRDSYRCPDIADYNGALVRGHLLREALRVALFLVAGPAPSAGGGGGAGEGAAGGGAAGGGAA